MRHLILTSAAAIALLLGACSKDEAPAAAAPATESSERSTTIKIDGDGGSMSYESGDEGGGSTSISVGDTDDDTKE